MASKSVLLFGLLLATLLLVATAARDLAENTGEKSNKEAGFEDQKYPYGGYPGRGYGGYPGGGYGGYPGRGYGGYPGGGYGGYPGGGYGGYPGRGYGGYPGGGYGRGYCRFGCCGRGYYGGGCRCCPYPGAETEAAPGN